MSNFKWVSAGSKQPTIARFTHFRNRAGPAAYPFRASFARTQFLLAKYRITTNPTSTNISNNSAFKVKKRAQHGHRPEIAETYLNIPNG